MATKKSWNSSVAIFIWRLATHGWWFWRILLFFCFILIVFNIYSHHTDDALRLVTHCWFLSWLLLGLGCSCHIEVCGWLHDCSHLVHPFGKICGHGCHICFDWCHACSKLESLGYPGPREWMLQWQWMELGLQLGPLDAWSRIGG
jgi:hypothetical protein